MQYDVGKWYGWNGGKCPVHPETVVDVRWSGTCGPKEIHKAGDINKSAQWTWDFRKYPSSNSIVAFRIIKEHKEPREFWLDMHTGEIHNKQMVSLDSARIIHVREVIPHD